MSYCVLICMEDGWEKVWFIFICWVFCFFFVYPCIEILKHWFVKIFFNQIKLVTWNLKLHKRSMLSFPTPSLILLVYWVIWWFWRFIYNLSVSYMVLLFKSVYGFGGKVRFKVRLCRLNFLFDRACSVLSVCGAICLCFVKGKIEFCRVFILEYPCIEILIGVERR